MCDMTHLYMFTCMCDIARPFLSDDFAEHRSRGESLPKLILNESKELTCIRVLKQMNKWSQTCDISISHIAQWMKTPISRMTRIWTYLPSKQLIQSDWELLTMIWRGNGSVQYVASPRLRARGIRRWNFVL